MLRSEKAWKVSCITGDCENEARNHQLRLEIAGNRENKSQSRKSILCASHLAGLINNKLTINCQPENDCNLFLLLSFYSLPDVVLPFLPSVLALSCDIHQLNLKGNLKAI